MAIPAYCSSDSVSPQVISSENPAPSNLDFVLSALWSWAANHPGHTFREFKLAYLRAVVLAGKGVAP